MQKGETEILTYIKSHDFFWTDDLKKEFTELKEYQISSVLQKLRRKNVIRCSDKKVRSPKVNGGGLNRQYYKT